MTATKVAPCSMLSPCSSAMLAQCGRLSFEGNMHDSFAAVEHLVVSLPGCVDVVIRRGFPAALMLACLLCSQTQLIQLACSPRLKPPPQGQLDHDLQCTGSAALGGQASLAQPLQAAPSSPVNQCHGLPALRSDLLCTLSPSSEQLPGSACPVSLGALGSPA